LFLEHLKDLFFFAAAVAEVFLSDDLLFSAGSGRSLAALLVDVLSRVLARLILIGLDLVGSALTECDTFFLTTDMRRGRSGGLGLVGISDG
jgi:hypothetical protein